MISFQERIQLKEGLLTVSELKIIDQLNKHEKPFLLAMNELATLSNVSEPSVVRLYRKLGYGSYQELKVALAQELAGKVTTAINTDTEIRENDLSNEVFTKISNQLTTALAMTKEKLNVDDMEEAVELILNAERIFFFGQGLSGTVAEDSAHKFMRIGGTALAVKDPHYQAIYASHMKSDDLVIAISHSGETVNIIEVVGIAKKSGAKIIIITSNEKTTLSKMADILLLTKAQETERRSDAMVSRLIQLALIDTIYTRTVAIGGEYLKEAVNASRLAVTRMKK
ncbi:MurR/RpiR family transcriptional regulator [Bacillus sp. FJAT-53060]|uniref:MurR/RpiR family transcriptional regulator n=1 Tax=Bacillus sp. FJAT-53060 TaxID=3127666 RepID=UPI003013C128